MSNGAVSSETENHKPSKVPAIMYFCLYSQYCSELTFAEVYCQIGCTDPIIIFPCPLIDNVCSMMIVYSIEGPFQNCSESRTVRNCSVHGMLYSATVISRHMSSSNRCTTRACFWLRF